VNTTYRAIWTSSERRRFIPIVVTLKAFTNLLHTRDLNVRDLRSITIVGIDAREELARNSPDVRDLHVALVLSLAITTRTVKLAERLDIKGANDNGAAAIVLNNFIVGTLTKFHEFAMGDR
jgi:hypothetical protein